MRSLARWLLVALYLIAGAAHLARPAMFIRITPGWAPDAPLVIALTGLAELIGALALAQTGWPALRRAAGLALAAYAVCVSTPPISTI